MSDAVEVAITSDASGSLWTACVWDIRNGTQLMTFKSGGVCGNRALSLVGMEYVIGSEAAKPLLHVWPVNSMEPQHELRTVCPGLVGALAVSPNKSYIAAGIGEKIHLWQVASGRLLAIASRHFQAVTCIKFLDDDSHFVSAGEDGMVLVWSVSYLTREEGSNTDPVHSFHDHYLAVKDIFVGNGGMKARVVSVSLDGTCKVYDLQSGKHLLSLVIDMALTSVTGNVSETSVFVGTYAGPIFALDLREPPRQQEHHLTDKQKENRFSGHTKPVNTLSASQDAATLLSGSMDETVRLWHIASRQCLRILHHKGPITNAFITFLPAQMFAEKLQPTVVMHRLQRSNDVTEATGAVVATIMNEDKEIQYDDTSESGGVHFPLYMDTVDHNVGSSVNNGEVEELKKVNEQLFKFAVDKILSQTTDISGSGTNVPSLINIDIALQQISDKAVEPQPIFRLKNKKKKPKKKARLSIVNGRS